ncbi:FAD-dependent oxidoreductase [Paraburkholderia sp. 35.1]|uniref:FAD-dependent oxidoreductase n=1 Tax=unclassified Paraburkholderia TaxID=2615204 RepID=UPI003D2290AB
MRNEKKIAIIGAGPVGLTTALGLARRDVPCVVYEAGETVGREQRGAAFHPPTLEMLRSLGVESALMEMGLRIPVWQMRDRVDGVYAEFNLGLLADVTDFPFRYHLPQYYLSNVLLDELRRQPNVELRFGETLQSVETDGNSARLIVSNAAGQRETHVPWVVGADGARSTVRKTGGFTFDGFTWPEKFLVTNVRGSLEDLGYTGTAYVSDPDAWAVVLKLYDESCDDLWRVAMPADPETDDDTLLTPENIHDRLKEVLGTDKSFSLVYSGTYRVHQRVADTFVKGRILLAGDAAHINNPIGGFGLNGGIHDACSLANRLADVWQGKAGPELLELYSRQRRTVALEVVQKNSIRNKNLMEERDPEVRRRNQKALRDISLDTQKSRQYLMETSMISSIHRAEQVN